MDYAYAFILIIILIIWSIALFDISRSRFESGNIKLTWIMIVTMMPLIGLIIYVIRREKISSGKPRNFDPAFKKK